MSCQILSVIAVRLPWILDGDWNGAAYFPRVTFVVSSLKSRSWKYVFVIVWGGAVGGSETPLVI